jgi:hypothetical protein
MIFMIVALILIALVVYVHFLQGFLSATMSAVIAAIAASLAMGWQETVVQMLLKGKMQDYGNGLILVALFAGLYALLRAICDRLIPGNIELPLWLERGGAAVMGVVAALFCVGIVAVAMQMLPFGPSILGYSRFDIGPDRQVQVPPTGDRGGYSMQDETVYGEVKPDHIGQTGDTLLAGSSSMPVDEFLVSFVSRVSDGVWSNDHSFTEVHPVLLDELAGQRMGIPAPSKHTALNIPQGRTDVKAQSAWVVDAISQADGERVDVRRGRELTLDPVLRAKPGETILVVAITVANEAADDEPHFFRFSPGSIHLVAGEGGNRKDYYPLGTLDTGGLRVNRADDYLVAEANGAPIYLVFLVQRDDVLNQAAAAPARPATSAGGRPTKPAAAPPEEGWAFKPGTLLEVKRLALIDLTDLSIGPPKPVMATAMIRKKDLPPIMAGGLSITPQGSSTLGAAEMLVSSDVKVTNELPFPINVGRYDGDSAPVKFSSGTGLVAAKQFVKLEVEPVDSTAALGRGDFVIRLLATDPSKSNMRVVRVHATIPPKNLKAWEWSTRLKDIQLFDAHQTAYPCHGAIVRIQPQGVPKIIGKYDATAPVTSISQAAVRPTDVWLFYLVPTGTQINGLKVGNMLQANTVLVQ